MIMEQGHGHIPNKDKQTIKVNREIRLQSQLTKRFQASNHTVP